MHHRIVTSMDVGRLIHFAAVSDPQVDDQSPPAERDDSRRPAGRQQPGVDDRKEGTATWTGM
jgi:hypothetical protein